MVEFQRTRAHLRIVSIGGVDVNGYLGLQLNDKLDWSHNGKGQRRPQHFPLVFYKPAVASFPFNAVDSGEESWLSG